MGFREDMEFQRGVRDRLLVPWYSRIFSDRFVLVEKSHCSTLIQKRLAVDTVAQVGRASLCIEEKIVRPPKWGGAYSKYFLETHSCTAKGYESPGWMQYGEADVLLYCFTNGDPGELDVHAIPFQWLRRWARANYHQSWMERHTMNTRMKTKGIKAPFSRVADAMPVGRWAVPHEQPGADELWGLAS